MPVGVWRDYSVQPSKRSSWQRVYRAVIIRMAIFPADRGTIVKNTPCSVPRELQQHTRSTTKQKRSVVRAQSADALCKNLVNSPKKPQESVDGSATVSFLGAGGKAMSVECAKVELLSHTLGSSTTWIFCRQQTTVLAGHLRSGCRFGRRCGATLHVQRRHLRVRPPSCDAAFLKRTSRILHSGSNCECLCGQ